MKVAAILLALALGGAAIPGCQAQPPFEQARLASKVIGLPEGKCSGTAVGRYTILSASHCFEDKPDAITVDGQQCSVWKIIHDGRDHALVTVSCLQKHRARIGGKLHSGDHVFVWGNPGDFNGLLRQATVVGKLTMPREDTQDWPELAGEVWLLDGALGKGDPGAAVFDEQGYVVGVVSFGTMYHTYPPNLFTGSLPFAFTKQQWKDAR